LSNRFGGRFGHLRRAVTIGLLATVFLAGGFFSSRPSAHGFGSQITWNREISRIVYDRCASCHRPGGTAFSLMKYTDAQPRANEIKDAVLSRRMPPWGAVKGFGHFRNDQSLTQEQIELITKWVDGGIRRGNNPQLLPKLPTFDKPGERSSATDVLRVQGAFTLTRDVVLDGLEPERVQPASSIRIVAVLPAGRVEPLVWLRDYKAAYSHPFLFREPLRLPAGTQIQGVPSDAVILLVPRS
jgi:hypothetical protein